MAVALNGLDLTDPNVMNTLFQSMNEMTEMSLTVERDGQQHDVYIQF
ncbi:general secretion pathway protein C [Vibrio cholerae]|nr:general secretion pathway protein C [Vibrio cholerae]CSD02705.1 general secretion pathway protein C [Vibrio cholerae]